MTREAKLKKIRKWLRASQGDGRPRLEAYVDGPYYVDWLVDELDNLLFHHGNSLARERLLETKNQDLDSEVLRLKRSVREWELKYSILKDNK